MAEYDKLTIPAALRAMSKRYIRKHYCKELLEIAATALKNETVTVAAYRDGIKGKYDGEQ